MSELRVVALLAHEDGQRLVQETCKKYDIRFDEFRELVDTRLRNVGRQRRTRLFECFDDILDRIHESD